MPLKLQKPKKPAIEGAVYVRLPEEIREWIEVQCTKEDRNISSMIRILLMEAREARKARNQ